MGKRGNGEGSIRRHGKSWHARIMDGYKPDGKPNIRYFSGKTQSEVRAKLNKFKQQRDAGVAWEQYDFSTWADKWFEGHKESISPTTIEGYRYTLRLLKGHFGTTKIAEIRAIDIEEFLRKLRENGRADATLAKCRGCCFRFSAKPRPTISFARTLWPLPIRCAPMGRRRRRTLSRRRRCSG